MNRLVTVALYAFLGFLFLITVWTMSLAWLWVALISSLVVAAIDLFVRKDKAVQENRGQR